ncbi:ROK family protein [Eubacteriales bacterium mix99]
MKSVSIDLGGTTIKLAVVKDGSVLTQSHIPALSGEGLKERLPDLEKRIREMVDLRTIDGMGIAFPGIVDPTGKRILSVNGKYTDAMKMDLDAWCQKTFGLEMILENDANAALAGELSYGAGRGYGDAVIMILGTGVGTAAAMGGHLLRSKHHQAGCLGGHIAVEVDGRPCTCGSRGCLEANASTWALPLLAREDPGFAESGLSRESTIDYLALETWYKRGDPLAIRLFNHSVKCWSTGIINLIHAYDPELVILSGGVIKFKELYEPIVRRVRKYAWTPWGEPEFRIAKDPEQSVVLGVHGLLLQFLRSGMEINKEEMKGDI